MDKEIQISQLLDKVLLDHSEELDLPPLEETYTSEPNLANNRPRRPKQRPSNQVRPRWDRLEARRPQDRQGAHQPAFLESVRRRA